LQLNKQDRQERRL